MELIDVGNDIRLNILEEFSKRSEDKQMTLKTQEGVFKVIQVIFIWFFK